MSDVPILDTRVGNREDDGTLARRLEGAPVERLVLDGDQRRRSRFRARTEAGTEVGVVAGGDALRRGDVLAGDELTVVVDLAGREAVALDFGAVDADAHGEALAAAAGLGHRIGNRHRDLVARGATVLVAVGDDDPARLREDLAGVDGLPSGTRVRVETVDPSLFDDAAHSHAHDGQGRGHAREHEHDHEHDHDHDHDGDPDRGSVTGGPTDGTGGGR